MRHLMRLAAPTLALATSVPALPSLATSLPALATPAGRAVAPALQPGHGNCADLLPAKGKPAARRLVTARDIAMLRDFGGGEVYLGGESPISLSPDGKTAAFMLSRAEPDDNAYCQALILLPVTAGGTPRIIAAGGEFLSFTNQDQRGLVTATGMGKLVRPAWSPDGRWLLYLRRDAGKTRVWRAAADGSEARPVAEAEAEIEAAGWTPDGSKIVYTTRPALLDAEAGIERESRSGYLYDDRFVPMYSNRPQVRGPLPLVFTTLTPGMTDARDATTGERRLFDATALPGYPATATIAARTIDGRFAWVAPEKSPQWLSPTSLWAAGAGHGSAHCTAAACGDGIQTLWWTPDGRRVRFVRRDGQGNSQMAVYVWTPGDKAPRRTFATEDNLIGCQPAAAGLLCLRESSTQPARLVLLDPDTGRQKILFDPNPAFRDLILGTVKRLHWHNDFGMETFGDLVLPPDRRPGELVPLIVVQYHSRGFLRGGTGDEYPIHAFAAQGLAVLSVERVPMYTSLLPAGNWPSWKDAEPENVRNWNERRSLASSVMAGIDKALSLGAIDPGRIGLTGLSDGMTTAAYLLSTTDRFAATSISTCCADPKTDQILVGPRWEAERQRFGYPLPTEDRPDFWKPVSLAVNAPRIRSPLLMQLADDEYLRALETYTAFRYSGPPVEMYLFAGEHHVKWQPAHRLAIYQRNLDWFRFWLQGQVDPDPAKRAQYARWAELRKSGRAASRATRP